MGLLPPPVSRQQTPCVHTLSTVSGAPYEVTEAAPVSEKLVQGGHQYHEKSVQCRTEYQTIWDTEYQEQSYQTCETVYYFSKFIDLADSMFFVARKKFTHLSPLHVIHHGTLPLLCWWGPRFVGGGQSGFGPFLNSGVHMVMYLYYFLAACGPSIQKYLWWKRYLTTIQLVQFVLVFIHALQPIFFQCDYPIAASLMFAFTGVQYFFLFLAFYRKAYNKTGVKSEKKITESNNNIVDSKMD